MAEEPYRAIVESAEDPIFISDRDGRYLYVNRAAALTLGFTPETMTGKTAEELFPPHVAAVYLEGVRRVIDGGETVKGEDRSQAGGVEAWFSSVLQPLRDDSGRIIAAQGIVRDITSRKQAEQALRASEERLRQVIRASQIGVFDLDFKTQTAYWSPQQCAIWGLSADQPVIWDQQWPNIHPDDVNQVRASIARAHQSDDGVFELAHRILTSDGERSLSVTAQAFFEGKGAARQIVRTVGATRDVTSIRRTEDAVRGSEERLRQAVRASNIGIWDLDFVGQKVFWSPQQRVIWGWGPDEPVLWGQYLDCVHPDDREMVNAAIARVQQSDDGVFEVEHRIIRRDGSVRWLVAKGQTFFAGDGAARHPVRSIGASRDITGEKQAEDALRESEERLRQVIRASNIGTFDHNLVTHQGYWSPQQREIWGISADEPIVTPAFLDSIHPDDRDRIRAEIEAVHQGHAGGFFDLAHRIIRRDGSERWISVSSRTLYDEAGTRPLRTVGATRDITDEKRAAAERAELQQQLAQSQKLESIGLLAGGIAHDFNNILNIIIGCAEMATTEADPVVVRDYLDEILKAATRSANLTRQLLGFARRQTALPRVVDLNDFVSVSLKMLRRLIGEQVSLSWHPGVGLWPVRVDPIQIDQILVNVIVNARDAIGDVGAVVIHTENVPAGACASYSGLAAGDYVRMAVVDNGKGMDAETLRHLFEPFYTTKGPGHGTGLGMASVDGIVRQNGGTVTVTSEVGRGTTVNVFLPRIAAAIDKDAATDGGAPKRGTETVLVVEDEPQLLNLARRALEMLGYTVLPASSPEQAIAIAGSHAGPVHLLVTDVVMPGMNGRTLADRLLATAPNLKCLFVSGYSNGVMGSGGMLDEDVHFLQKPFSPKALAERVRAVLEA